MVGFGEAGCASQPYVSPQRLDRGLVLVLPGIEGRSKLNEQIARGLNDGGVDWAIRIDDWTSMWGPGISLRDMGRNLRKADDIAREIEMYHYEHPGKPVVLVGQSGGGGMAAFVAEELDPSHQVDGIVMLAPALSPTYMLDRALKASRKGLVNFYSKGDWVLLGVGTTIAGTMDGKHTSSAGRIGFVLPLAADKKVYKAKLYQVPYQKQMAEAGYSGGHISSSAVDFVADYVAPLVLAEQWSRPYVAAVAKRPPSAPPPAPPDGE